MGCCDSSESEDPTVLFLGAYASGKTTVLYQLKLGESVPTIPTIGFNIESITFKRKKLRMMDICRRDDSNLLLKHYAHQTDAIILVIDSNDTSTLVNNDVEWTADSDLRMALDHPDLVDCPFLILANKQDEPRAMSAREITERLELEQRMKDRKWHIQPCCATSGVGLSEGLDWLVGNL